MTYLDPPRLMILVLVILEAAVAVLRLHGFFLSAMLDAMVVSLMVVADHESGEDRCSSEAKVKMESSTLYNELACTIQLQELELGPIQAPVATHSPSLVPS